MSGRAWMRLCAALAAAALTGAAAFRLVWPSAVGREVCLCAFGAAMLTGLCIRFGRR